MRDQLPIGLSADEWESIQDAITTDQYRFEQTNGIATASNRLQDWNLAFDENGLLVTPRGDKDWQWGLSLSGYGYASTSLSPNEDAPLSIDANTLTYQWNENISEWWINDPAGLEQGFTLQERPHAPRTRHSAPLVLEMAVTGTLTPIQRGDGIIFQNADGVTILTYDHLLVTDAEGKVITAHMQLAHMQLAHMPPAHMPPAHLQIVIDDATATYPLTIDPWMQTAKLDPSDGDSDDYFGYSVAVSGDTVVVGAPQDEHPNGSDAGSAYIFEVGGGWADGHANQVAKLDPSDGDSDDYFGYSVAVSGDTVVVGAFGDEDPNGAKAGSAYIFEVGGGWADGHANQVAKLDPSDGDSSDQFGFSVAVSGDTVVVGAFVDEHPNGSWAGSAYVFAKGGGWGDGHANQVAKLDPDDGDSDDFFGISVAVSGDTVVVGAIGNEDPNGAFAGSAYIFEVGGGWADGHANQVTKLDPSDGDSSDQFGTSVAVSGDTIVVGAIKDEDPNGSAAGSAYVFELLFPDLEAAKNNDTGGASTVGTVFNWSVTISNTGQGDAFFAAGETILKDELPAGPIYGPLTVDTSGGATGTMEVCKNKIPFLKWSGRIGRQKG